MIHGSIWYTLSSSDELRKKDEEQAALFEQKMELHMRLHQAINFPTDLDKSDKEFKDVPDYLRFVRGEGVNSTQMWQEVRYLQAFAIFFFTQTSKFILGSRSSTRSDATSKLAILRRGWWNSVQKSQLGWRASQ